MNTASSTLVWLRRDLRLRDNAALIAGADGPVVPVFILDPVLDAQLGAAARLRLKASLERLGADLAALGAPLTLRRGSALDVLRDLARETGAAAVTWTRLTDGPSLARDKAVKAALKADGLKVESFGGFTLRDPWEIRTGAGEAFKVFTPFSRALLAGGVPNPLPAPKTLMGVSPAPRSDALADWALDAPMGPAGPALATSFEAGEAAAFATLDAWLSGPAPRYREDRDALDKPAACTGLSPFLALGEISPRSVWSAMDRATLARSSEGVEAARRQLIWRDFAHMLLFHDPEMERLNWRREWSAFPWAGESDGAENWRRGETGIDIIDAAMRQLWVTGLMHNRARMLVASYLTKHMLTDWRIGEAWFRETLIDWDPANNAMGWQWVAGSGPDAAPFFRIFNPETQANKFDASGRYCRYWLDGAGADAFRAMIPKSWTIRRPALPIAALDTGRKRALAAWQEMRENA